MKKIYFLLLALLLTQSCNPKESQVLVNGKIDVQVRSKIEKLNKDLLSTITSNNIEVMKKMIDTDNHEGKESFEDYFKRMHEYIKDDNYTILDEYHIKNNSVGGFDTLQSINKGVNNYKLCYPKRTREMFISLILVDSFNEKVLLTVMYGKLITGWKITVLHIGGYTTDDKTAPQLYVKSKKELEKGFLINSASAIWFASQVLTPAGNYLIYPEKENIKKALEDITKEIKIAYILPMPLEEISTKPQIFNIYPDLVEGTYGPFFKYITYIDLKDTVALKLENDKIHSIIKDKFKGVDKGSEYIFYEAFNQLPDGHPNGVPMYGFYKKND